MPQQASHGIDVSKEEEQYLRRAFRRFALPYVLVFAFAAVAWATTFAMSKDGPTPGSPAEISALRDKVTALEQSIAALEGRVGKVGSEVERARSRVGALEKGKSAERASTGDAAAVEKTLRDATRRIAELERRDGSSASAADRIDALFARMQRIEGAVRGASAPPLAPPMPAAPAPAAPAPAP